MSVTSANRLELLQIADAVAREKMIDPEPRHRGDGGFARQGARARATAPNTTSARAIDRKTGELAHDPLPPRGRGAGEPLHRADASTEAQRDQAGRRARRRDHRLAAADGLRPHRRPVGQAGDHAEGPRGRAAAPVRGVQGPRRARSSTASSSAPNTATSSSTSAAARRSCAATSSIQREAFRNGDRVRALIREVRHETRGPQIFLSRAPRRSSSPSSSRWKCRRSTTASSRSRPSPATRAAAPRWA